MRTVLVLIPLLFTANVCHAQASASGYVVFGAGGWSTPYWSGRLTDLSGGGEKPIAKDAAVGVELGLLGTGEVGLLSVSGTATYRPGDESRGTVPFVRGGVTVFAGGESPIVGPTLAAGVTHWFRPTTGLVVEFRDVIYFGYSTAQLWSFRVGVAFR
jgi:hypothetical protein